MIDNTINDDRTVVGGGKGMILARRYHILCQLGAGRHGDVKELTMIVKIISFSFKRGLPEDKTGNGGGFVFDCRAMPNPFWDESLRGYTGQDKPIADFFAKFPDKVNVFLDASETLVRHPIEEYRRDDRNHLQVAFGCTGGQHRSVYFAERMAERLAGIDGVEVAMSHMASRHWKLL